MARTIEEIENIILQEKESRSELNGLTSNSKVSIWRNFIYIIAYIIFTLELLFDSHKKEVNEILMDLKPHTARWYRNKALAFQYGFDLYLDTDEFNNEGHTEDDIKNSKIVKYSAVTEAQNQSRLIIKIATENGGKLSPLDDTVIESFTAYMEKIRDAGVPFTIINYLPDLLYLNITIKRDALVLDNKGNAIAPIDGDIQPIETSIKQFLRELPFNGELVLSKLTDKLQATTGVKDINIDNASTAWIDPTINDYGQTQSIYMSKIPESGYFTTEYLGNSLITITYVV
ncbi:nucleotidyltransferase [Apibacter adventoris]|uniref:nucleotidyltransferase n=1 Tax=Apibacter adventoris TaxID=1679466 RepID=UPI000CF74FC2|nr:nucleotidyltransferase [Apibacter adventoris]PQL95209.1 nucleotidyltransferase [Apibacter adventoris]